MKKDHLVRKASKHDITAMVKLSYAKRLDYEKAQPQFWCHASQAEEVQSKWFEKLLTTDDHVLLVAHADNIIVGFIIGRIIKAPEVYDPGGFTLMIDDFCIRDPDKWKIVGGNLIKSLQDIAKEKGAEQTLVVCGAHDNSKRKFLKGCGLSVASEWYVGGL